VTTHVGTEPDLAFLDGVRGLVLPRLRTAVTRLDPWLAELALGTGVGQGELVHAALTVLAAEALGGSGPAAVPGAVAVELAHHATLVREDIVGDALRTVAFELLAEHENRRPVRMLGAAMRYLVSVRTTAGTGALMSAALAIGAELAGGPPKVIAVLAQVGQHLGRGPRQLPHARELLAVVPMPAPVRDRFDALCAAVVGQDR
jgi:hypothetical protein